MALTLGVGPFSPHPAGSFDVASPHRPLLFWEPFHKRLRIIEDGETVADSRDCLALHYTGEPMQLAVPCNDVELDRLTPGADVRDHLGAGHRWSMSGGMIARSIEVPPDGALPLADHMIFDLAAVDAWYLEDDLGYAHPRDPYHRFDVQRSSRHVVVKLGETVIAESRRPAILFETSLPVRYYLAPDEVRTGYLRRSETVTQCPYKGDGQHWTIAVPGHEAADACWNLTAPLGDALMIPRWFSFYPNKVVVEVDGERLS